MKVTLLGCGTSVGVPAIGRAGWGACDPDDQEIADSAVPFWSRQTALTFLLMRGRTYATSCCRWV